MGLEAPEAALPALAEALRALRAELAPERGYLCIEAAPPGLKSRLDALGTAPGELNLMRLFKARFDPRSVLAPGRYLGPEA
jgi:glycolate oxidase FAD binding subunit